MEAESEVGHPAGGRVSIGLPVYNGERFLRRAVESVLAQTFEDWDLLISDNGSEDRTLEIATQFAASDDRIRVRRNPHNLGATANFEAVFEETSGAYFMWLAYDDWIEPTYLERCVAILDSDPSTVLVFAHMNVSDETDVTFRTKAEPIHSSDSSSVHRRFHAILWRLEDPTSPVFGVMRRDALACTGLIRNSNEPDRILLGEMALLGKIRQIPEKLFNHYGPPGHTDRDNWAWLNPLNRGRPRLATYRITKHQLAAIKAGSFSWWRKALLVGDLLVATGYTRTRGKAKAIARRLGKSIGARASGG